MNKYELVIFDLDGTLLDTTEGVIQSVKYTINQMGYEMLDDNILSAFIGPPIQNSFANVYHLEGDVLQEIATIFRNRYKDYELFKAMPYEGIYDLFRQLANKGMETAVATYKREDYAISLLNHFNFQAYTNIMFGADHENKLKKNDIIKKCIDEAQIRDYRKVVMVGDTIHDAIGAGQIGVDFIGVTYGFGFKTEKDLDDIEHIGVANTPLDILKYV